MSFGKKTSINKIKELYQIRFLSNGIAITVKTASAKKAKAIIENNKDAVVHLHSDPTELPRNCSLRLY
mgnify:CR=1 FL=1|jgi:hypothetical protein|nr:MAG TPA: hypothetical protein [Caudoviricetes sp.]